MTDTMTADLAADAVTDTSDQGLGTESSTPEANVDATNTDSVTESAEAAVEALFELDGTPITLDEAKNGYLRQADYTRKTQELAARQKELATAEAIAAALATDPERALVALAEAAGLQAQFGQAQENLDPETQRILQLEAKIQEIEAAERNRAIDAELSALHGQYGDFDDQVLFAHAIKHGHPSLQAAYADLHFAEVAARAAEVEQRKQAEASRAAAAKTANGVVHSGGSRTGTTAPSTPQMMDTKEAWMAALKAHGAV